MSTASKSISWVQSLPSASGVWTPLLFKVSSAVKKSGRVFGMSLMPAFFRTVLLVQTTLARWMFAGTE